MNKNYLSAAFEGATGDERLLGQLSFLFEVEKLKAELRQTLTYADKKQATPRRENSAEHSWHITLFALMLKEYAAEPVDIAHVVEMMLVHEIVEVDAGDTDVYSADSALSVHEREALAADRLFGLLPQDQAQHFRGLWDEFEENKTPEARYARAIDRVHPILANYLSGGKGWRERGISHDKVVATHAARVSAGAPQLWEAIRQCLDYGQDHGFFPEARKEL